MATFHKTVAVNTTAVRVSPAGVHSGMDITVQNLSSTENVYLGGENVTTTNFGFKLVPNAAFSVELAGDSALYAVSGAAVNVAVLETGLEYGG